MQYFMVHTAKEILFSTGILFNHVFFVVSGFFFKGSIFSRRICKIQGHFQDLENVFVFFRTRGNPDYL